MRRSWLIVPVAWALFGWLHATQIYLGILGEAGTVGYSYRKFIVWQVCNWLLWAALTPVVVRLSRRWPVTRARAIAVHVAASVLTPCVRVAGMVIITQTVRPWSGGEIVGPRAFLTVYSGMLSSYFHLDLIIYWAIVGVVHAIDSRQRSARAEAELAQAQLANLRLQLQPHFLFNTLHAIASLVRDGRSDAAVTMIAGLSELLRYSLDNAGRNIVPLSEELQVVERYLEIQQTRFPDRLAVRMNVDDDARDAGVPTLLLQPLVENAIRHGIGDATAGGRLEIRAHRAGRELVLEVFDDGPPLPAGWQDKQGIGLTATRARLEHLYGGAGRLELENEPAHGVIARVRIPFSRGEAHA